MGWVNSWTTTCILYQGYVDNVFDFGNERCHVYKIILPNICYELTIQPQALKVLPQNIFFYFSKVSGLCLLSWTNLFITIIIIVYKMFMKNYIMNHFTILDGGHIFFDKTFIKFNKKFVINIIKLWTRL